MGEGRYLPRKVGVEALTKILVEEHGVMKAGISKIRDASGRLDYEGAAALRKLDPISGSTLQTRNHKSWDY